MADFLKLKLALAKTNRSARHTLYDPTGSFRDVDNSGLIASQNDYDLGTPNLNRHEDITLVGSNSTTKEAIVVTLKWRPINESGKAPLVTQISKLTLVANNESIYEYEQVETFPPVESHSRPNRYTQFGCHGSSLKFSIASPYRRMRLMFHGHMKKVSTSNETPTTTTFVKLNLVLTPVCRIFDFNQAIDVECFKKFYQQFKPSRGYEATLRDLFYHDRHEQMVRWRGDCLIEDSASGKFKKSFLLIGWHARHFVETDIAKKDLRTKRIMAIMQNGQSWHIGINQLGDNGDCMGFGYTCFEILANTEPIDKPYEFNNWDQLGTCEEFQVKVSGESKTFEYQAKRRLPNLDFFDVSKDTKKGWAWVTLDSNAVDSPQQLEAIEQSRAEYCEAIDAGALSRAQSFHQMISDGSKPLVVCISDSIGVCKDLVGSKAASLGELSLFAKNSALTYEVPHAFATTLFAHDALIEQNGQLTKAIESLQLLVGSGNLKELRKECENLQNLVENTKLPENISSELKSKLSSKYGDTLENQTFAVRSSSWGEDEEDMSAAGQLRTLLGIKSFECIQKSVMSCFASKFSFENIEYKRQHGLPLDMPMAVVIQEMIECEKAGVMFTCDPTSGDECQVTITANYGLGESVVSGQSDPDSIRVRCPADGGEKLGIESVTVGQKKIVIDLDTLKGQTEGAKQYDRSRCCLTNDEIIHLSRCGKAIEKYFRCPRDIEWGYKGSQMYLFQSRPVTGLESYSDLELIHECDQPSRAETDFYTRANIGEVLPYAIKPLSLTYTVQTWNVTGVRLFKRFLGETRTSLQNSVFVIYEAYHSLFTLRANSFLPMSSKVSEKSVMSRAMEVGLFGHELDEQPDIIEASEDISKMPNMFEGLRFKYYSLPLKMFPLAVVMREKKVMRKLRVMVENNKLARGYEQNKMLGLYNQMSAILAYMYASWENHMIAIALGGECNMILMVVMSKYLKDPKQLFAAATKFLGAAPNVISAEIPQRIADMAKLIRAKGEAEVEKFVNLSTDDALDYIESGDDSDLKEKLKVFFERFGHRCYSEFDLCQPAWREDKGKIIDMLKKNCKYDPTDRKGDETEANSKPFGIENKPSIDEIIDSLQLKDLEAKDRAFLSKYIGPRSQLFVAARECTKDIMIDFVDIQRTAAKLLAQEMQRQLRIPDEELFHYLLFDELEPLIRDYQPSIIMQAIRRRNMFKRQFSELWKFDEIIRGPELIPNHLKQARELDAELMNSPKLFGTPASSGKVRGKICLVDGYQQLDKVRPGSILLTHSTDIAFSPVFPMISGIITEVGGLISHGAVVAREYGLPSILGIPDITRILQDGEEIILDADNGTIIRLGKSNDESVSS